MHLTDLSMLDVVFAFVQGATLGAILCFVTMECVKDAATAQNDADRKPIDVEWKDVSGDPSLSKLRRLV